MAFRLVGWGLLLVLFDLRLNSFDVLPDVVGWGLVLLGLVELSPRHARFALARWGAVVGCFASAVVFALFFSERQLAAVRSVAALGNSVAWLVVTWGVLTAAAALAAGSEPAVVLQARRLRTFVCGLAGLSVAVSLVALAAGLAVHGTWTWQSQLPAALGVLLVVAVVVRLLANLAFVVFCFQHAERGWLRASGAPAAPLGAPVAAER